MKSLSYAFSSSRKPAPAPPFEPSARRIKVSLHDLVNSLLSTLQPLAMKRNNIVLNGIPQGLCFVAEENVLAYVLWNMISTVINNKNNECIHVQVLVEDHRTMICVKNAGTYIYKALDYRKLQDAAETIGGCIDLYNDDTYGNNLVFSICNSRMAV